MQVALDTDPPQDAEPRRDVIRVLVVDDHPVVSHGVATIVRDSPIAVVGSAETAGEACRLAPALQPDVVLLDVRLGDALGSTVVRPLLAAMPDARVLMFTAFPDHPAARSALEAGASGCVVKDTSRTDLVAAITAVARGPAPTAVPPGDDEEPVPALTPREREILRRVALGRTNGEIAAELFLAPTTVKTYWQHALRKLGARNRAEAITRAYQVGLL